MRFLVLGPLEVTDDAGRGLPIAGSKERTLLACLISSVGRVVPAGDLVDELWGDGPPRTAARTLGSYVSRVRRALDGGSDAEILVSKGGGYSLDRTAADVDALRFQEGAAEGHRLLAEGRVDEAAATLERALSLWRGRAYQEFRSAPFGVSEGERLEELRRAALEDLADARLASGADPAVVGDLEAMVREEPLRERRWGQLMLALYRSGRQAEALDAFARARAVLVDELGIEPGAELQRLQAAVLAHDPALERGPAARTVDVCPYKGLARFEADDADVFFGREALVSEAIARLVERPFLALVGASGSGKSSLLRAGILPALGAGAIPGSGRWATSLIRPGEHPFDALAGASAPRVLAVDQFEEVFTACDDDAERSAFIHTLTNAALDRDRPTTVILAMRADLYGRCASYRPLASLLAESQILVGPMDEPELRLAIERPAERVGLTVEPTLTDALIADTRGEPGALPLLSTALLELWTHRTGGVLTLAQYHRAGGVDGAVARLAEDAYARLDDDEAAAAKRILLRLASSDDEGRLVRRRAAFSEFNLDRDGSAARALGVLADARLVTVAEGTAEVAHEALLREWPRLRAWLDEDAEGRKVRRHLTASAGTWDEGGRDAADLYRGARLTAATEWAAGNGPDLNDLEREFMQESRFASDVESVRARRTNRRLGALLAGVALLLVASLVIGTLALRQRDDARNALALADAGRLASRSAVEEDPVLALLLAKEAVSLSDTAETRGALFAAIERGPAIVGRSYAPGGPSPEGDETQWIALSPDGATLAIGDAGPTVQLFDAVTREPGATIDVGSGTERATFAPDGRLVVVTSEPQLVAIDVTRASVTSRVTTDGDVGSIAFASDGSRLVTADTVDGPKLVERDPETLEPIADPVAIRHGSLFSVPPLAPVSIGFTPDDRLVTTASHGDTVLWNDDLTPASRFPIGGDALAVSPIEPLAAIVVNDDDRDEGDVTILDLRTGEQRAGTGGHHGAGLTKYEATGVGFTPDGTQIVTTGNDSRLITWDVASGTVLERLGGTGDLPLRGPAISGDASTAFTTDRTRDVVAWDLSGVRGADRTFVAGDGFAQWPWFAISPDGRTLAVPSLPGGSAFGSAGAVELVDTDDLRVRTTIPYPDSTPEGLAFSPDSATLAVSAWSEPSHHSDLRLWNVATGRQIGGDAPGLADGDVVWTLEFRPDGRTLAAGARILGPERGRVYLFDAATLELDRILRTDRTLNDLAYTPDGSLLAGSTGFADGGDTILWDARTGRVARIIHTDDAAAYGADFSGDGRLLITAGQSSSVRVFRTATGEPVGPSLAGLIGSADTADLSPDGRTVVGADSAGAALLWDIATGTVLGEPLPGPTPGSTLAASFTPDGRRVIVMSDSGSGWVWDVDPADWATRACAVAGRSLSTEEWHDFLPDRPYRATC